MRMGRKERGKKENRREWRVKTRGDVMHSSSATLLSPSSFLALPTADPSRSLQLESVHRLGYVHSYI